MQTKQIALILLIMLIGTSLISGSIPFTTSQFINQTTDGNYTTFNLNGYDGLCLVVDGNKISFDNCLNVLVDGNIIGESGQIPFLNIDGNALSVQNSFDFNSDTNTLRTGCVELGDGNSYCASTDFPNLDLSNATTDINLGANNLITQKIGTGFKVTPDEDKAHINFDFDETTIGDYGVNGKSILIEAGTGNDDEGYAPSLYLRGGYGTDSDEYTGNIVSLSQNDFREFAEFQKGIGVTGLLGAYDGVGVGFGYNAPIITNSGSEVIFSYYDNYPVLRYDAYRFGTSGLQLNDNIGIIYGADSDVSTKYNGTFYDTDLGINTWNIRGNVDIFKLKTTLLDKIFTSSADWTLTGGFTISAYTLTRGKNGATAYPTTPITITAGKRYYWRFETGNTISTIPDSYVRVTCGGVTLIDWGIDLNASATSHTYEGIFTANDTNNLVITGVGNTYSSRIKSIELYEIGDGDLFVSGNINANTAYIDGNISANDFITRSNVADFKSETKELDKLNNIDKWKTPDGKINYEEHYAFVNISNQVIKEYKEEKTIKEVCEIKETLDKETNEPKEKEVCGIKEVITQVPIYEIVYTNGLSMETRIASMEKMIWELNEKIKEIKQIINEIKK
jgi:hypothetical protein